MVHVFLKYAGRVAQLVRATGLHPVGRGFESLSVHHFSKTGPHSQMGPFYYAPHHLHPR